MSLNWVRQAKLCDDSGISEDAANANRAKGVWPEGVMWRKGPDGRIYINVPAFENWVAGTLPVNLTSEAR